MRYLYDYRTVARDEDVVAIANQWGKDGWRWINPREGFRDGEAMIFEFVSNEIVQKPWTMPSRRFEPKGDDELEQR